MNMEIKSTVPQGDQGAPAGSAQAYERSDASIPGLLKFALGLAILIIIVLAAMKWTFDYFAKIEPLGPPASPFENARLLPPNPRLQAHPHTQLEDYCQAQQQELNSYGWIDEHNGVVQIPMDHAMDLVLQRGLPTRSASEAPASTLGADPMSEQQGPQTAAVLGPCSYLAGPSNEGPKK